MSLPLPMIPQDLTGNALIAAVNDRLRRISVGAGGEGAAGPAGVPGAPGTPGAVPGKDTQIIYNGKGVFAASPLFVFDATKSIVTLTGGLGSGFVSPLFNSTANLQASPPDAPAFQVSDGSFTVYGSGDLQCQTVQATTTFNSLADQQPSPGTTAAFQTSGGDFVVFGSGALQCQNAQATTTFNSLSDHAGNPATTAAFQTSGGTFVIYGDGHGVFQTLTCTSVFNSLATGTTAAVQQSGGTFVIYGNGAAQFQTVQATTTFNSLSDHAGSPATTAAFQTSGGTFVIYGDGHGVFQTLTCTSVFNSLATGTTAAFQQVSGTFVIYGNGTAQFQSLALTVPLPPASGGTGISTTGTSTQVLIGGTPYTWGKINLATMATAPGADTEVIYNSGGQLTGSSNFVFTAAGLVAPLFNAGNTGSTNAFQTASGSFSITGNGSGLFQNLTCTTVFNSEATGTIAAVQQSGGTFVIYGNGAANFQNVTISSSGTGYEIATFVSGVLQPRWITSTNGPETGNNAGTDLSIYRYADDGSYLGLVFQVQRSTGNITISNILSVTGTLYALGDLSISGATSSAREATFTGFVETNDHFICKGSNGVTITLQDNLGVNHSVVGGIIVS